MTRAVAPACRKGSQASRMLVLPPVIWPACSWLMRHGAVGRDGDPRIRLEGRGLLRLRIGQAKADGEPTAGGGGDLEEFAAGDRVRAHALASSEADASLMAARMRP
jgi:hypothetical protein